MYPHFTKAKCKKTAGHHTTHCSISPFCFICVKFLIKERAEECKYLAVLFNLCPETVAEALNIHI